MVGSVEIHSITYILNQHVHPFLCCAALAHTNPTIANTQQRSRSVQGLHTMLFVSLERSYSCRLGAKTYPS